LAVTGSHSWFFAQGGKRMDRVRLHVLVSARPVPLLLERHFKMERAAGSARRAALGMAILTGNL
jgi:hypothetical protein